MNKKTRKFEKKLMSEKRSKKNFIFMIVADQVKKHFGCGSQMTYHPLTITSP